MLLQKYGFWDTATLRDLAEYFIKARDLLGAELVYVKGKRKTEFQRDYEKIYGYLERVDRYHKSQEIFGTLRSYSKTDTDATFMRMTLSHAYDSKSKTKNGYEVIKSYYICESCDGCGYRESAARGNMTTKKYLFPKQWQGRKPKLLNASPPTREYFCV